MNSTQQIIFRGDDTCYFQRDGGFPYIDHAFAAGATGVLIWFWGAEFRGVASDFITYCKERGLGVHLGIGIGSYGICDGENPLDPKVMAKIKDHIDRTVEAYDIAGIEYQTGEYDLVQFKGGAMASKSHARQICDLLNPYIEHILKNKSSLWVRTELNAEFCPEDQYADVARMLDSRCTVEWSRFTGPFNGEHCFSRGRSLLELADNFSWFLKIAFKRDRFWQEIIPEVNFEQAPKWIEHWRGWVKLLKDFRRSTLTICNVDKSYIDLANPLPALAAALARNPDLPTEELMSQVRW